MIPHSLSGLFQLYSKVFKDLSQVTEIGVIPREFLLELSECSSSQSWLIQDSTIAITD